MSIHTACPLQLPLADSWEEIYILYLWQLLHFIKKNQVTKEFADNW